MFKKIKEGKIEIYVPKEKKVSKALPVFYNSIMKFNRDISIVLLEAVKNKEMKIGLPLAGSGVRGIRLLKELKKNKIEQIHFNDYSEKAIELINKNIKLNKLNTGKNKVKQKNKTKDKIIIHNKDANLFLRQSKGFDYIDIDPFGTPNPYLDSAMIKLSRKGILAITATDTSALCGTFPKACRRKYWAEPLRNELKHEIGLRILTRKIQLVAAQYDKALLPIYSYSKDHYMRVFFSCEKGKTKVDKIIKQHEYYKEVGPMWLGKLWDKSLAAKIHKQIKDKFTETIANEAKIEEHCDIGFYDIHVFCKKNKLTIPRMDILIEKIKKNKYKVSRTHFSDYGIRSNIKEEKLIGIIKKI